MNLVPEKSRTAVVLTQGLIQLLKRVPSSTVKGQSREVDYSV